jgi:hypothetical protein
MTSFVSLVMQAAADECHGEAAQIEEEVQRLLSEVEHTIEDATTMSSGSASWSY